MKTATTLFLFAGLILGLAATATARSTDEPPPRRIEILAYELQEAAHTLHYRAERRARWFRRGNGNLLEALHSLDREATRFHRRVRHGAYHADEHFYALMRSYRRARREIRFLPRYHRVYDDFYRIERLMYRLARHFGDHRWNDEEEYDDRGHHDDRGPYYDRGPYDEGRGKNNRRQRRGPSIRN